MQPTPVPIDHLLQALWENKATDLLLTADAPPLVRVDGQLFPLPGFSALSPDDVAELVSAVLGDELTPRLREEKHVDFSFGWNGVARFRGNAFMQRRCPALALRLISFHIPSFDDLGLPAVTERLVRLQQGFVLVTGATGSGKSTTLASMLDRINATRACHILTIEDPIEYVHHHQLAAVNQREVGEDTPSFAEALRSALREDPDVVLIGEMRDPESIAHALTIAETGHLVFATLHTNDSSQTVDRIVDVFPAERQPQVRVQLANCLSAILHQRLLRKVGGGRVAAFEVLMGTAAARNLIREGKSRQLRNIVATGQAEGMQTLEASLSELVASGTVEYEEAVGYSLYPKEVKRATPVRRDALPAA